MVSVPVSSLVADWSQHLPGTIEAFIGDEEPARGQHRHFLEEFHLSASEVPLLKLDPHDWQTPFTHVEV